MAYVRVVDPLLDPNKPTRSDDIKQMRDNQDNFQARLLALEAGLLISDQGIYDDFNQDSTTPLAVNWTTITGSTGTAVVTPATGVFTAQITSNGTANWAGISSATADTKMQLEKSQEFKAVATFRTKRNSENQDSLFFGWQDVGVGSGNVFSDISDSIAIIRNSATGGWQLVVAQGGSSATIASAAADATVYNELQIQWTGSASAGTRLVELFTNGVSDGTIATDANMPTADLIPMIGLRGNAAGGGTRILSVDYAKYGFIEIPKAA